MSSTEEVYAAAAHLVAAFGRHDTAAYFDCFATGGDVHLLHRPRRG